MNVPSLKKMGSGLIELVIAVITLIAINALVLVAAAATIMESLRLGN